MKLSEFVSDEFETLCRRSQILDHLAEAIIVIDLDHAIIDWNGGATRTFGWSREEMQGQNFTALLREEEIPAPLTGPTHVAWHGDLHFPCKNGTPLLCEATLAPLRDAEGSVNTILAIVRDITPRQEMKRRSANEQHLLRTLFDAVPDPIFLKDCEGRYLMTNQINLKRFRLDETEYVGKTVFDIPGLKEHASLYHADDMAVIETGEPVVDREEPFIDPDGSEGWFLTSKYPVRDTTGQVIGLVGIARDITKRRQAERQLLEEQQMLRTVLDALPDPVFFKDCQGMYVHRNRASEKMFTPDHEHYVGKTVFDLPIPRELAQQYATDDQHVIDTGEPVINREEPYQTVSGKRGWFLTSKFPLYSASGEITGLVGICRDITEIRHAATALAEAEQRLVDHVENSPLAVVEWGVDLQIIRWTGRAEAIFGWRMDEVTNRKLGDLGLVHPEDVGQVGRVARDLLGGSIERSVSQCRNLRKDGGLVHCIWHDSVLRDPSGKVVSIMSLVQDVTERVLAEEAVRAVEGERLAIERKLQEAQKLESLGVLAGGIAHDFNNLLTGILGNASLASEDLPESSPVQPSLEQIEKAAMRAAELCRQMLAYSGKGRFIVRRIDLNQVIEETINLLRLSISKNAALRLRLASSLPPVLGDPSQLQQVVMNLIINASEALEENNGVISLTTGLMYATDDYFADMHLTPDLREGEYIYLEVSDNGKGMAPEVKARIFDPFFTTKFTGRGLGLAAVLGIVRGHDGALKVESKSGVGTMFRVLLPAAHGESEDTHDRTPAVDQWRGSGTVLVVDDEETVRVTSARMLANLGFDVVLAQDGQAGVRKFASANTPFVLVMLDLTMPRLGGEEAFQKIRRLRPDARVLLMSGFDEQEIMTRFSGKDFDGFIQKPFRLPMLRAKLKAILEG